MGAACTPRTSPPTKAASSPAASWPTIKADIVMVSEYLAPFTVQPDSVVNMTGAITLPSLPLVTKGYVSAIGKTLPSAVLNLKVNVSGTSPSL